jgi:hypothetical protein
MPKTNTKSVGRNKESSSKREEDLISYGMKVREKKEKARQEIIH